MLQHVGISRSKENSQSQASAISDSTHFPESTWGVMSLSVHQTTQNRENPEDVWETMRPPDPTPQRDMKPSSYLWQDTVLGDAEGKKT